jgi:hypothetical protein
MNAGHCLQRIACPQNQLGNPPVAISRLGPGPRRIPIALPRTPYWRQPSMLRQCLRNISSRANACRGSAYASWPTSERTNAVCCERSPPDDGGAKNRKPTRHAVRWLLRAGESHLRTKRWNLVVRQLNVSIRQHNGSVRQYNVSIGAVVAEVPYEVISSGALRAVGRLRRDRC